MTFETLSSGNSSNSDPKSQGGGIGDGNIITSIVIRGSSETEKNHPSKSGTVSDTEATVPGVSMTACVPKMSMDFPTLLLCAGSEKNSDILSKSHVAATTSNGQVPRNEAMKQSSIKDDNSSNDNPIIKGERHDNTTIVSAQLVDASELAVLSQLQQLRSELKQVVEYQQSQEEEHWQRKHRWRRWHSPTFLPAVTP